MFDPKTLADKKKSVRVFLFPDKLSASKYWELPDKKSAHVALRIATKYFPCGKYDLLYYNVLSFFTFFNSSHKLHRKSE